MHRTEALSSSFMLTHLDNQSNMRKHRDFWHGELKKKKKKGLYTKDVDLLTKKSEYQSDNTRVPFSCFKMKALCGCWTAGSTVPTHCDTATSSAEWKSWGTTANSVPVWMCCNNCLFSHTNHEGGENLFSKKDAIFDHLFSLQHLGSCMSWSIVYSSYGDILFACSAEKKKKTQCWNRASNEGFLKLDFLLDAEFRLLNLPGRQMVTVNYRFSQENPVIFCASHVPEVI